MTSLPQHFDSAHYWRDIHRQPLPFWRQALAQVAAIHQLSNDSWMRATLGRNVVFLNDAVAIKFGPPCWPGEMAREAAALHSIAGRLPVATPLLVASGSIDGWDYLVQQRLPGANLHDLWPHLDDTARAALAYQHGTLMAALHSLQLHASLAVLQVDWQSLLAEQQAECIPAMRAAGVDAALVEQVAPYLASTPWDIDDAAPVLLHGDLNYLNFLVSERDDGWQITGLIDWGDAKIGPRSHEYISPGVHMYKGNARLLAHWYRGYGRDNAEQTKHLQHLIMARAVLYYADHFQHLIQTIEGAAVCRDWLAMATAFWHLDQQQ